MDRLRDGKVGNESLMSLLGSHKNIVLKRNLTFLKDTIDLQNLWPQFPTTLIRSLSFSQNTIHGERLKEISLNSRLSEIMSAWAYVHQNLMWQLSEQGLPG